MLGDQSRKAGVMACRINEIPCLFGRLSTPTAAITRLWLGIVCRARYEDEKNRKQNHPFHQVVVWCSQAGHRFLFCLFFFVVGFCLWSFLRRRFSCCVSLWTESSACAVSPFLDHWTVGRGGPPFLTVSTWTPFWMCAGYFGHLWLWRPITKRSRGQTSETGLVFQKDRERRNENPLKKTSAPFSIDGSRQAPF